MTTLSPTDITRAASVALALLLSAGIVKADNLSPKVYAISARPLSPGRR